MRRVRVKADRTRGREDKGLCLGGNGVSLHRHHLNLHAYWACHFVVGVWVEKHENTFQEFDTEILSGNWSDSAEADRIELFHYLNGGTSKVSKMGVDSPVQIAVLDGKIQQSITILHNRSIAEGVEVLEDGSPYTGTLTVDRGAILEDVDLKGYSLIHSASLTAEAFTRSAMGDLGRPVVALVLSFRIYNRSCLVLLRRPSGGVLIWHSLACTLSVDLRGWFFCCGYLRYFADLADCGHYSCLDDDS